ncbi:TraB/GumN family protein [Massilia sp. BJB1822]|uniref:TraB/GumN family protein n=1 Tax=Massilia sp. BJB1822 TaxID=2744470 RepID=UPI0015930C98|nr:TraB/GumN family protein [Massilia sp. BJB1822]NVD96777.1 TraB/GumN family protein [Massilia sp. BJB1822]
MRRLIIVIFYSLFCLTLQPAWAQQAQASATAIPNRGVLFKAEQGGNTLYLFGTIHVGSPDFYPLEPRITEALMQASVLALEIDPLADQKRMLSAVRKYGVYAPGSGPASAQLPPASRARLERALRKYGIPPEAAAPLKPWMLTSALTIAEFGAQGYQPILAVDAWLSKQAHARRLKVEELESVEGQMSLFGRLSDAEQLRMLEEDLQSIEDEKYAGEARELMDAWSSANPAALDAVARKLSNDATFSGKFMKKVLLEERNPQLADGIAKLLAREKLSVAAIGALHLVGWENVPELLRRRGIAVERVY